MKNTCFNHSNMYYKVTNEKEYHDGLQLVDGRNDFNQSSLLTKPGNRVYGVQFIDVENITNYLWYREPDKDEDTMSRYVREVFVPKDATITMFQHSFRASSVILGRKFDLLNPSDLNILRYNGMTTQFNDMNKILWYAVRIGSKTIIDYALNNGADISSKDNAALSIACVTGNISIVKYLVEHHGATIRANNNPLINIIKGTNLDIIQYLNTQNETKITEPMYI